jgi:hypothetical protein
VIVPYCHRQAVGGRTTRGGPMKALRTRAALAGVALLIAGCGSTAAPSSSPATSSEAPPSKAAAAAICSDSDDPRLQAVTLTDAGDALTVEWQTQDLGTPETVLWAVMVTGQDGGIYQLAVKQIGTKAQSWVFDFGTAAQQEVSAPGALAAIPTGVSESFPHSKMLDLGATFEWQATLNIDGGDVAFCPGSGTGLAFAR